MFDFKFEEPETYINPPVSDGDIRLVTLQVKVLCKWSDQIVSDYDEETGEIEYESGFVMEVLPNQKFVYKNQPNYLIAHTIPNV